MTDNPTPTPECGEMLASCVCRGPSDHVDNHACACGGVWTPDGDPVMFPGGLTEEQARAKALAMITSALYPDLPTPRTGSHDDD